MAIDSLPFAVEIFFFLPQCSTNLGLLGIESSFQEHTVNFRFRSFSVRVTAPTRLDLGQSLRAELLGPSQLFCLRDLGPLENSTHRKGSDQERFR